MCMLPVVSADTGFPVSDEVAADNRAYLDEQSRAAQVRAVLQLCAQAQAIA